VKINIVSWNFKGMGSMPKIKEMKDLITSKKPYIFLLQETKTNEKGMEIMIKKQKIIKEPQFHRPKP